MGGMSKTLQLHRLNISNTITHWSWRNSLALLADLALGLGMFLGMHHWLKPLEPQVVQSLLSKTICGLFLIYFLYSLASSSRTWFSSAHAFYLTTAPLPYREVYFYHLIDTVFMGFKRLGGYLVLPSLMAMGVAMQSWWGFFTALFALAVTASMAVNFGFLGMFVLLRGQRRPGWWTLVALGGMGVTGFFYGMSTINFSLFIALLAITAPLAGGGSFFYGSKVFHQCLDNAEMSFDFDFKSPRSSRCLLGASVLPRVFRAYLYKELVTDWRNVFFYARYALVIIFLLAYIPLSHWRVLEGAGLAGALIYCYWAILANFHETFASAYIKEGSMITFLLPWSASKWMGAAKFLAAVLEELPFVVFAAVLCAWRWSTGPSEAVCLASTLGLLLTGHLVLVMVLASLYTSLEHREGGLFAGMLYEYVFAGINPGLLSWYMAVLAWPALLTAALLGLPPLRPGIAPWSHIWVFDGILATFILLALNIQLVVYQRKLSNLMA